MRGLGAIMAMEFRLFWRAPQAAFWTFFFPAFLLVLLGAAFARLAGSPRFLVPGLMGMVLASTSLYGVGVVIAAYRSTGFLKRLALVPIPPWQFVAAHLLVRALIVVCVGVELVVLSLLVFGVHPSAHPLTLAAVLGVGLPAFLASGFAVGMLAPSVEAAGSIASLLFFPMTFLSGSYFPITLLPDALARVATVLPLTYFLHGLRAAADGVGPAGVLVDLAALAAWGVAGGAVSLGRFRWTV